MIRRLTILVVAVVIAPAAAQAAPRSVTSEALTGVSLTADSLKTWSLATRIYQHERGPRRPWYARTTFEDGSRLWQKLVFRRRGWVAPRGGGPARWARVRPHWIVWDAELIRADGAVESD